jgi:hypothetical protein
MKQILAAAAPSMLGLVFGAILFQASSVAFDYMRLRQLPIYASAASLEAFSEYVFELNMGIEPRSLRFQEFFRDRATIDFDLSKADAHARSTITQARQVIASVLTPDQQAKVRFAATPATFAATEGLMQGICPSEANSEAGLAKGPLPEEVAPSGLPAPIPALGLDANQSAAIAKACAVAKDDCAAGDDSLSPRSRMICAQRRAAEMSERRDAINGLRLEPTSALADMLKLRYPSLASTDVDAALKVNDAYRALMGKPMRGEHVCGADPSQTPGPAGAEKAANSPAAPRTSQPAPKAGDNAAAAGDPCVQPHDGPFAGWWRFWLSLPLAVLYMALGFIFGSLGSLSSYLYATSAPDTIIASPETGPVFTIIAGGGAAILVLLVVMAGFQFLTVGASTPELAYPNPLTVCGLSVVVGLQGYSVLGSLKSAFSKLFPAPAQSAAAPAAPSTSPPPQLPPAREANIVG